MGNRKLKWTAEEEEALKAGVAKYGAGKWKSILTDSDIKLKLAHRSNVDLKDKWRNLGVSVRQGSGANTMTPNIETTATIVLPPKTENSSSVVTKNNIIEMTPNGQATAMSSPPPKTPKSSSVATKDNINEMTPNGQATAMSSPPPKTQNSSSVVTKDNINEKPSQSSRHAKNGPTYGEMIFEALSSIKDRNGSDFSSILEFIQKKHEVPQNFKKSLSSRLRKLVMQGKVKRVDKRYKIKQTSLAIEKASPKRKVFESKPRQKPRSCFSAKAEEDAAKTIAKHIAEAEHKLFIAAEAIHESERVSRMAEDSDALVMHLKEIFELSVKTKQTSSMAAEAMNESARMSEDSNAAIMHLKEIFEQWEKTKQTTVAPNIELSTLSFT